MSDESILEEAQRLVHGARQGTYGHPLDDLGRTGKMWGAILGTDPIPAETVALCMIAVKLSREVNAHKRDNLVDAAGYAEAASLAIEERGVRDDAAIRAVIGHPRPECPPSSDTRDWRPW